MSAPLRLTPSELHDLADALIALGNIKVKHGVDVSHLAPAQVTVNDDVTLNARWDEDEHGFVIDDRYGS